MPDDTVTKRGKGRPTKWLRTADIAERLSYKDKRPVLALFRGPWTDAGETFFLPGRGKGEYAVSESFFLDWMEQRRVKGGRNG